MAQVELADVTRAYGPSVVVDRVSTVIDSGQFVAFLGPSGCGKTTTLRMIAGLDEPTAGRVFLEGRLASDPARGVFVPPERRRLGMVFQSYALWPHMSVGTNVAYPLLVRGSSRADAWQQAVRTLDLVRLPGLADRRPHQLSGGQQQRVALARALVMEPSVLLLDEPLSNLDAGLREEMRFEIKDLQQRLGITVVFVTHDQSEAFALSDRILVMNAGRIVQAGRPTDLYRRPADPFVAAFLGVANLAPGHRSGGRVLLDEAPSVGIAAEGSGPDQEAVVVIVRPEAIDLVAPGQGALEGRVERVTFLGDRIDTAVRWQARLWRVSTRPPAVFAPGDAVGLAIREAAVLPAGATEGPRAA